MRWRLESGSTVPSSKEQAGKARGNLDHIVELTARVGAITGELRNFARRAPAPLGPVPLQSAIDGALLLIGDRLELPCTDPVSMGVAPIVDNLLACSAN